jgi:hypothetical protein
MPNSSSEASPSAAGFTELTNPRQEQPAALERPAWLCGAHGNPSRSYAIDWRSCSRRLFRLACALALTAIVSAMATTSLAWIGGVGIAGVIAVAVVVMLMVAALILTTIVSAMAAAALTRIGRVGVPSVIAMAVVTMFLAAGLTTIVPGVPIGVARTSIGRPCITAAAASAAPSAAVAATAALVTACAAVAAFLTAAPLTFAGTAVPLALAVIGVPGRVCAG